MKRLILTFFIIIPLFFSWTETETIQNELIAIEKEIQTLKEKWHRINLKQMQEEVKGQSYFIANWEAYRRELELIRQQEEEDNQIEQKIKQLEERKAQILNRPLA